MYTAIAMNNGLLRFRTCFSSISHSGYKLDILECYAEIFAEKRRSKMIWCVAEIYLFYVFAKSEQEKKRQKVLLLIC